MPEIIEGNRPGEPPKPFSCRPTGLLMCKPLDKCNIESGTIQAGFFFKSIGVSYAGETGLSFFIQNVSWDHWTLYAVTLHVYNQRLRVYRWLDGTKTTVLDQALTIPLNQLMWLGVDFSHYTENGTGLLKIHATAIEGNIIRADTLRATVYDPGFTPGGSVGIYESFEGENRVVDLTAGSPAHAEFADEARALRGTILAGDDRRVRYNEDYNRFEWSDDGTNWTAVTADPGGSVGDMLKVTYDQDDDGVVDAAESAPWAGITGKPLTFPPDVHAHDWTDITDKPSTFPPDTHGHDERYYTEAEVDDLIEGVSGAESNGLVLTSSADTIPDYLMPKLAAGGEINLSEVDAGPGYKQIQVGVGPTILRRTSANRPGVTKLYRRDNDSNYNVQTVWDGTRWLLRGYTGDTYHAECRVGWADAVNNEGVTVYRATNYNIPLNTWSTIVFSGYLQNPTNRNGWDGATAIYAWRTGWYHIQAAIYVEFGSHNNVLAVQLMDNGASFIDHRHPGMSTLGWTGNVVTVSAIRYLTAGRYVQLYVNPAGYGSATVMGTGLSHLGMVCLGG